VSPRTRRKIPHSRPARPARPAWLWLAAGALAAVALAIALYLLLSATPQKPLDLIVDLQQYRCGVPPTEFDYDATGPHGPLLSAGQPYWRVYVDRFAPSPEFVLIQAAALAEADHYPLALLRDVQARDVTLSVYLKPMGGTLAQGAGLLWRARDKDNYYAVLADPLDQQVHLLRMVRGQPHELAAAPIEIGVVFEQQEPGPTWGWYLLKVEAKGRRIAVWFQDQMVLGATDATFTRSGRVGLITHADAVALFDDFRVQAGHMQSTPTPRPTPAPPPPPVMHVAAITTTGAAYHDPQSTFARGGSVYWRIQVVDEHGAPVPAAVVTTDVLRPDGTLLSSQPIRTGTDGVALFSCPLPATEPAGTYTIQVSRITHSDLPAATYDPAANLKSTTTFSVQ
jgi:hypothetical protein